MKTQSENKCLRLQSITRLWGGIPVKDSEHDLRVIIKPCDVKGAVEKDPENCVFAKACRRSFGTKKVLFFRRIAYVEIPDENGESKVERFFMSESVHNLIRDFDRGNAIIPHGGFLLKAPSPSNTLESKRIKQRANEKRIKEALLKGESLESVKKPKHSSVKKPKEIDMEIRSGKGMVHFT